MREGEGAVVQVSAGDRYRIDAVVGAGGMGEVYRGTDTILERSVAIKFLTRNTPGYSAPERLLSEARSASALSHPNVCTIYEVSESDGRPCIVMEFIDGQPLSAIIPPGVGLPIDATVSYGMQIADALAHAHEAGVIHRDLKTANVIVSSQQRLKVLDFGLAVQEMANGVDDETSTVDECRSGSEPGTPGTLRYLAPEVLRGERADRQSDIWALGAVLYEMAAGRRPFNGRTPHEISAAILTQSPEPLPSEVPSGLRSIIRTCLTRDRARRYHSASEVRAALEALQLDSRDGAAASISRRVAVLLGVGLLAAVVVALAASIAALTRHGPEQPAAATIADSVPATKSRRLVVVPSIAPHSSPEQTALAQIVVELMIDQIELLKLPGLTVLALPTVLRLQKNAGNVVTAAREELSAEFVVLVTVSTRRQHFTFNAELINAADTKRLWGKDYLRDTSDFFGIESEVAQGVAETLLGRLSPGTTLSEVQRKILSHQQTQDFSAYQLYAEGRRFWYLPTATPDGYRKSLDYYDKALEKDPNFALAYLGKADTIGGMAWEGWRPPIDSYNAAADALRQVERLEPQLGQALYNRAGLEYMQKDWASADRDYRAAIEADPSLVTNRRYYALFLVGRGRMNEALAVLRDLHVRDPFGFGTNLALATTLYWAGDADQAIARLNEIIDADPSEPTAAAAREILGDVYESMGRPRLAIMQRVQALRLNGDVPAADELQHDYDTLGFKDAMHNLYRRLQSVAGVDKLNGIYVSPVYLALIYIHLNEVDKAFDYLDEAVRENAPWLQYIRVDPAFQPIRSDPRFEDLVHRYETTGFPAPRTN